MVIKMENTELLNNILSDIGNFILVVFGFSATLFTVLYSFILSKKEQMKEYSDKIKSGSKDFLVFQRHRNASKFISKFRKFNIHLIITLFLNLGTYLFCLVVKYVISDITIKLNSTKSIGVIALLIVIYLASMLVLTVRDYLKVTKIE